MTGSAAEAPGHQSADFEEAAPVHFRTTTSGQFGVFLPPRHVPQVVLPWGQPISRKCLQNRASVQKLLALKVRATWDSVVTPVLFLPKGGKGLVQLDS